MKIIVSGGGTGGHIYPAITLIRTIQAKVPDCEVLYVGTKIGLEADIIPKEGFAFKTVDICGFARKLTLENIKTVFKSVRSVCDARKIVKEFNPDVVIGTGGYVCGPVLMAASLMGIPTLIQEQNVIPGITNKILAKFVKKIAVGCKEAKAHFPKNKVIFTGNPIRQEVMNANKEDAFKEYGFDSSKKTILISGGSRGARSINQAMLGVHQHFSGNSTIQLLHVTGKNEYNDIVTKLQKQGIDSKTVGNIMIKPYLYDMPKAMAMADLAIFRAGATGLAELTAKGIPAILVPYPYAAENHQEFNALALQNQGAAVVIRDCDLSAKRLIQEISELLNSDIKLVEMKQASLKLGKPTAADEIANLVIDLAKNKISL